MSRAPLQRQGRKTRFALYGLLVLFVSTQAYSFASKKTEAPANSTAPVASSGEGADRVWVKKPDGAIQCDPKKGQALEIASKQLKDSGIPVYDARKGSDGMMRAQVCGIPSGSENRYLIPKQDLEKAKSLGFAP